MKMKDINKKFTELVSEYISKGYTINLSTMSGSQGEVGKVDLIKGNHFIRIYADNGMESGSYLEYTSLCVGEINNYNSNPLDTIWYKDLTTVYQMIYYKVGTDWYVESKAQALDHKETHYFRVRNQPRVASYWNEKKDITSPKFIDIAVKYLKRVVGYQRISRDEIIITHQVTKSGKSQYCIQYKGQTYRLK